MNTKLTTTKTNLQSKKARQMALAEKIRLIDEELDKIGVLNMKYLCTSAISNPETPQNTIHINSIADLSFAIRILAHYQNIKNTKDLIDKQHRLPNGFIIFNQNSQVISNIIHDLNLKIATLINADKIKILQESKAKLLPFLDEDSRFINALKEIDVLLKNV
jgi:hypothetical protein